jgi:alpha-tubulin suppressor-like RCC1 family protein
MDRITSVIWGSLLAWNLLSVNLCAQPSPTSDPINLRLEITNANNSAVAGLIHNSSPLVPYAIFSKQSLLWPAWVPESTFYGDEASTNTPFAVSKLGRNNLFLQTCAQLAPQTITAGSMHFAVMKRDGSVWTWGINLYGQLGDGTWSGSLIPTQVIGLSNIVAVVAPESSSYTLALDSSGTVWSWGMGRDGELGRADGRYENENLAAPVPGLSNIVAIAGGWGHAAILKSDGSVWTWGNNWGGQLGDGTSIERDYAAPVPGLTNAIAIASGGDHNLVLCADGTVWAWGYNWNGQLGIGNYDDQWRPVQVTALTNAIALGGGYDHSLALLADGSVMAWGRNNYGQLGNGTYDYSSTPATIPALSNIVAIASGDYHSIALDNQGTLFLWGKGSYGQLGNGITRSIPTPFSLNSITNVVAIAGGQDSSIASTLDGKTYIWGLYGCQSGGGIHKRAVPFGYDLENRLDTDGDGLPDWLETGIGSNTNNPDSDYDGRTDLQEVLDGTDPLDPNSVQQVLLGSWQFNSPDWTGDQGQPAMVSSNITCIPDWSGHGLHISTNLPAGLSYHEANGADVNMQFNINLRSGSVVFWYKPDWSSAGAGGSGPGKDSVLFGSGSLGSDFWGMVINASGSNLDFRCVKDGQLQTFLTAPVSFASNQWVQIALTYSSNSSALYVNGQLFQTGAGVSVYPDAEFRKTNGFNIGSSFSGGNQALGDFDQLTTYNYRLTTDNINGNYSSVVYFRPQNVQFPALLINSNQVVFNISGVPLATLAILVNSTDFSSAVWNTCYANSNITVTANLPPAEGTYTLAIGYIVGRQTNIITKTITVDTTPPAILPAGQTVITTNGLLQLAGTSSERLADIQFDVANVSRTNLNQTAYIMGAQVDSTSGKETTNQFQCFDILLAPGTNFITVHARDFAGNTATNMYVYVLDISGRTAPPVISVQWPQNDAKISGTNFAVCGQLDDPATQIKLTTVVSGVTNTIAGSVARNGRFWIQNVPSPDDTGQFILAAQDIAGNTSSVVETVSRSTINLTVNSVAPVSPSQSTADVSGRINASDYRVTVNGINATVSPDGSGGCNWTVNVPVPAGGSFSIHTSAIRDGNDTADAETLSTVNQAGTVRVISYNEQLNAQSFGSLVCDFTALEKKGDRIWTYGLGGTVHAYMAQQDTNVCNYTSFTAFAGLYFNWTASWPPTATDIAGSGDVNLFDFSRYYTIPWEHCEQWGVGPSCPDLPTDDVLAHGCNYFCRKADTRIQLFVGDKGLLGQSQLVKLTATATANDGTGGTIPAENIVINGQRLIPVEGGVGVSFQWFPTGTNVDVTPRIVNYDTHNYSFAVTATNVDFRLAVDNNRDGSITFETENQTTADNPYRFWVNNDNDGYATSIEDYADLDPSRASDANNLTISCKRDLEDYTRLWINTQDITEDLISGKLLLALEWKEATEDPRLQFFISADTNGSLLYLTDSDVAAQQITVSGTHVIEWAHRNVLTKYNPFIFPPSFWSAANVSPDQRVAHLLFDAVGRGSGQLVLSIYKNDGTTKLAESQPIYLKLQDVKEMYERWTVDSGGTPATTASLITEPYSYDWTIPAENNYILFVHGWNLAPWERDAFAETAFKRLYWQGYKGHFGAFQWPTEYGFSGIISAITDAHNYDNSESNAWASATGLLGLLNNLNIQYPNRVRLMAHSMGNVVAGEALKQANSQVVDTYVAMQAAVPAHCYDPSKPNRVTPMFPNPYASYWTNGAPSYFNGTAGAGTYVNFYNQRDWALGWWNSDQSLKPDSGYGYNYDLDVFTRGTLWLTPLYFPTNTYEIFAYADPACSNALGRQANVGGAFLSLGEPAQVDLDGAPFNFGPDHKGHSAEFNSDNMNQAIFWNRLIDQMGL